jgi:hypothetical protein
LEREVKTELTGKSPLRWPTSVLGCSVILRRRRRRGRSRRRGIRGRNRRGRRRGRIRGKSIRGR